MVQGYINKREARLKGDRARTELYRGVNLGPGTPGPAPEMPEYLDYPSPVAAAAGVALGALTVASGAGAFKGNSGSIPGETWNSSMPVDANPTYNFNDL
jgi:hypothetical protein